MTDEQFRVAKATRDDPEICLRARVFVSLSGTVCYCTSGGVCPWTREKMPSCNLYALPIISV